MLERVLTIAAVANLLERHPERILDAILFGELPSGWAGGARVIPAWAIPPYRRPSEEEG